MVHQLDKANFSNAIQERLTEFLALLISAGELGKVQRSEIHVDHVGGEV